MARDANEAARRRRHHWGWSLFGLMFLVGLIGFVHGQSSPYTSFSCPPATVDMGQHLTIERGPGQRLVVGVEASATVAADSPVVASLSSVDATPVDRFVARYCLFGFDATITSITYGDSVVVVRATGADISGGTFAWSLSRDVGMVRIELNDRYPYADPSTADPTISATLRLSVTTDVADVQYSRRPATTVDGTHTWTAHYGRGAGNAGAGSLFPDDELVISTDLDGSATRSLGKWIESNLEMGQTALGVQLIDVGNLLGWLPQMLLVALTIFGLSSTARMGGSTAWAACALLLFIVGALLWGRQSSSLVLIFLTLGVIALGLLVRGSWAIGDPSRRRRSIVTTAAIVLLPVAAAAMILTLPAFDESGSGRVAAAAVAAVALLSMALAIHLTYRLVSMLQRRLTAWLDQGADDDLIWLGGLGGPTGRGLSRMTTIVLRFPTIAVNLALTFAGTWYLGLASLHLPGLGPDPFGNIDDLGRQLISSSRYLPALFLQGLCACFLAVAVTSSLKRFDVGKAVWIVGLSWGISSISTATPVSGLLLPLGPVILATVIWVFSSGRTSAVWPGVNPGPGGAARSDSDQAPVLPDLPRIGRVWRRLQCWWSEQFVPRTPVPAPPATSGAVSHRLAVKISLLLGILPVLFVIWGVAVVLPGQTSDSLQVFSSVVVVLNQSLKWLLTGWAFSMLSPFLPGRIGPLKALVMTGLWFGAAVIVHIIGIWGGEDSDREWLFPGLQTGLFLVALSIVLDVASVRLRDRSLTWSATRFAVAALYHLGSVRAVILATVPVLVAIIALAEMAVSGSGLDFVKELLGGALNAAG